MWSPAYAFSLTPIERDDITKSMIIHLGRIVDDDRSEFLMKSEFEVTETMPFDVDSLGYCKWKPTVIGRSKTFSVRDGKWIRAHVAGMYVIGLHITYAADDQQPVIQLWNRNRKILVIRPASCNTNENSIAVVHQRSISMKKGDEIMLYFDEAPIPWGTKMSITRLGY